MDRRFDRALNYFDSIGLKILTTRENLAVAGNYRIEIITGIGSRAEGSSLRMTDTLLARSQRALKPGTGALVVEVGGAYFRAHGFGVDEDGGLKKEYGWEKRMPTVKFSNADSFFSYSALQVKDAVGGGRNPDALAVIYSYPGQAINAGGAVDLISDEKLPKGAVIPGISHKPVGRTLVDSLVSQGVLKDRVPVSVIDPSAAVLLGHPNSRIGAVLGRQFNIALDLGGVFNTQSGGFDKLPVPGYARGHDERSEDPGQQLAEKQIGGKDVGQQFDSLVRTLINARFIENLGIRRPLTGRDIADLLNLDPGNSWTDLKRAGEDDLKILCEGAQRLASRSAQIFGAMVGAAVGLEPSLDPGLVVDIPVEGSFFWGVRGYAADAIKASSLAGGRQINFLQGSAVRGAADLALRQVA